jgi:putative ABC transport system substrate-binding protein
VKRRDFIKGITWSAAAWPLAARAQQDRVRRVGVLMSTRTDTLESQDRVATFAQALRELGWVDGGNMRIETRWTGAEPESFRKSATELIALAPDVVLASTTLAVVPLQQATKTVPIVFVNVIDPVGSGLVASMARPGGNATGFVVFEYALAAKWLELLKEIAPNVTRAAILRDPSVAAGIGQFAAIQTVGSASMELSAVDLRDADEMERAVAAFARVPNGGLIVTASVVLGTHPDKIAALAARYSLPAVYPFSYYVRPGGLMSYGPDETEEYRQASGYIDRILKGAKPAELPVQAPTKYLLSINLKAAKALGLTVPQSLLARADEVIE